MSEPTRIGYRADRVDPDRPVVEGHAGAAYYALMASALRDLLLAKGTLTSDAIARVSAALVAPSDAWGARLVARAWVDPAYRARLLQDGSAAALELGYKISEARLVVVANTPMLHNLIVCTLCSCYPRSLLGQPPWWYISKNYRARAVREPRAVLAEFGLALPRDVEVRVHDSNADMRYLVLPMRPDATDGWPEERLATLVGRDAMIGTQVPMADVILR